jgi:hypothetical protein
MNEEEYIDAHVSNYLRNLNTRWSNFATPEHQVFLIISNRNGDNKLKTMTVAISQQLLCDDSKTPLERLQSYDKHWVSSFDENGFFLEVSYEASDEDLSVQSKSKRHFSVLNRSNHLLRNLKSRRLDWKNQIVMKSTKLEKLKENSKKISLIANKMRVRKKNESKKKIKFLSQNISNKFLKKKEKLIVSSVSNTATCSFSESGERSLPSPIYNMESEDKESDYLPNNDIIRRPESFGSEDSDLPLQASKEVTILYRDQNVLYSLDAEKKEERSPKANPDTIEANTNKIQLIEIDQTKANHLVEQTPWKQQQGDKPLSMRSSEITTETPKTNVILPETSLSADLFLHSKKTNKKFFDYRAHRKPKNQVKTPSSQVQGTVTVKKSKKVFINLSKYTREPLFFTVAVVLVSIIFQKYTT